MWILTYLYYCTLFLFKFSVINKINALTFSWHWCCLQIFQRSCAELGCLRLCFMSSVLLLKTHCMKLRVAANS